MGNEGKGDEGETGAGTPQRDRISFFPFVRRGSKARREGRGVRAEGLLIINYIRKKII